MKRFITLVLINLLTIAIILAGIEAGARYLFREIRPAGTSQLLIKDRAYGPVRGLRPGTSGASHGAVFRVNEYGFLDYTRPFDPRTPSILLRGDSVTMGIGVDPDSTFGGRLAHALDSLNVLNPSLIGYGSREYVEVLDRLTAPEAAARFNIDRVVLFWCLNDVYAGLPVVDEPGRVVRSAGGRVLDALRRHSIAYHAIKAAALDRPRAYYVHDAAFYRPGNEHFEQAVNDLRRIQSLCAGRGIALQVVLLPYEYQLRPDAGPDVQRPQRLMEATLQSMNIEVFDAADLFGLFRSGSSANYLYGDGIHFSPRGHRLLAGYLGGVVLPATRARASG